jgi:O-antigen/teichoic acid export membrane protein
VVTVSQRQSLLARPSAWVSVQPQPVAVRGFTSAAGIAIQGLVRFCYSLLIGRILPAGFLSATNSAISTAMLSTLLWPTSLGSAAGKFLARESLSVDRTAVLTHYLGRLCVLTSAALGVVAAGVTLMWLQPGDVATAVFVGLLTVGWSGYTFVRAAHYATNRVARATLWDALSFLVSIVGLVVVLKFHANSLLLLPLTVGYLGYSVLGWPKGKAGELDETLRREINRYVMWGVIGSLTTGGFLQLTMVLAEQTGDKTSADAYAAALTLATPASMIGSVLSLLLLPALSGAVGRGDLAGVRRQTDQANRGLIALVGCVFGMIILGGRVVVSILWPNLESSLPILEVLLVATFLPTAATACTESINSYTEHGARTMSIIRSSGFVVGLSLAVALIPMMGTMGIAVGYLTGMVITGVAPVVVVWRRDRQRWTSLMVRVLAGAVLVGVGVVLRDRWHSGASWRDLLVTVAFGACWLALLGRNLLSILPSGVSGRGVSRRTAG